MYDTKHVNNKNCSIINVKEGKFPDDIIITLGLEDGEEAFVRIMSKGMYKDQLKEMAAGKRERCVWAYGNSDIDLYKKPEGHMLLHSPHEGLYIRYYLKDGEFEKLFI
ncbi:hypothetical protein [Paenibacillus medicaginis]|uniref:Uncharacterized protein n=1 Tax=Paenibacillus medicaginis TaxID=1470560 RepID=A0ABV5BUR1_9BACL